MCITTATIAVTNEVKDIKVNIFRERFGGVSIKRENNMHAGFQKGI